MSVINDMLRDLDKRQAPELGSAQTTPQESLIEPQASPFKKIVVILVLLLSVLIVSYALFIKEDRSPNLHVTMNDDIEGLPENAQAHVAFVEPTHKSNDQASSLRESSSNSVKYLVEKESEGHSSLDRVKPEVVTKSKNITQEVRHEANPALKKSETASVEIKQETHVNHVVSQTGQADVQNIALERNQLDESSQTEKTTPKRKATEQKLVIEPKEMQVKLSPVALDQKMAKHALTLISKRQEIDAYRELYAFIGEHDVDMESRTVLATYLLQENRLAEVGDILLNAPLSESPTLRQIKARWYAAQGQHKLALYTLNSDLPDIETNTDYYVLLAAFYQRYGTPEESKETYSALVNHDESVADWWAGLGLASDRNKEKAKAIYAYQQALELKGLSPELMNFVKPRLNQLLLTKAEQ